jgi:hypothetical protein
VGRIDIAGGGANIMMSLLERRTAATEIWHCLRGEHQQHRERHNKRVTATSEDNGVIVLSSAPTSPISSNQVGGSNVTQYNAVIFLGGQHHQHRERSIKRVAATSKFPGCVE